MQSLAVGPDPADPGSSAQSAAKWRPLLTIFLASIVPGGGHLLIGETTKAAGLLAIFIALALGLWQFRIPRDFFALVVWFYLTSGICVASAVSATRCQRSRGTRVSLWWLALFIPVAIVAGAQHLNWTVRASVRRKCYVFFVPAG